MTINDQHVFMLQAILSELALTKERCEASLEILRTKAPPKKNPTAAGHLSRINAEMMRAVTSASAHSQILESSLRNTRAAEDDDPHDPS